MVAFKHWHTQDSSTAVRTRPCFANHYYRYHNHYGDRWWRIRSAGAARTSGTTTTCGQFSAGVTVVPATDERWKPAQSMETCAPHAKVAVLRPRPTARSLQFLENSEPCVGPACRRGRQRQQGPTLQGIQPVRRMEFHSPDVPAIDNPGREQDPACRRVFRAIDQ